MKCKKSIMNSGLLANRNYYKLSCQESHVNEVICSNNDCPIFYKRKRVQKDI